MNVAIDLVALSRCGYLQLETVGQGQYYSKVTVQQDFTPCNDLKGYNPLEKHYISAIFQTDGERDGRTDGPT